MKIQKAKGEKKKSCSFLLHSMSHTRTLLFGYTLPGSHFYFVSSFAALGLCNHTYRSITTLPWTLPKGRTTILIPTLGRAPCEGSGIHLLGDINLPWKDNVEQTALEEYAQTFIQNLEKQSFQQTLKHCQHSWNPFFWSISRPQVCNIKLPEPKESSRNSKPNVGFQVSSKTESVMEQVSTAAYRPLLVPTHGSEQKRWRHGRVWHGRTWLACTDSSTRQNTLD